MMFIGILPAALQAKYKKKPLKLSTWEIITNNIREEYDDQNEYEVAEALHGSGKGNQPKGRAFALGAEGPVDSSN